MKFNLTIEMDNAAFDGQPGEVAKILLALAGRFLDAGLTDDFRAGDKSPVRDSNGNTVGVWEIVEDDPPTPYVPRYGVEHLTLAKTGDEDTDGAGWKP